MSTLQNAGILVGAIGGIITICKFFQEQADRRSKRSKEIKDAAFEQWATSLEMSLSGGDGRQVVEVTDDEMPHAIRAVREGRLAWTGFPKIIGLPASAQT